MFYRKNCHRDMADIHVYTARKLSDMAGSLEELAIELAIERMADEDLEELENLLVFFGLPVRISGLSQDAVLNAASHDKKMDSGVIRFILLERIGKAYIDRSVTGQEMREALLYLEEG